ncbi:MAG: acyl-CoA reductase [Chloroflexi bacterium]|nr:acyl-CoA reductase [Chloroflexota bacterium]
MIGAESRTMRSIGWLPGLQDAEVAEWQALTFDGELELRIPRLSPAGLAAQLRRIAVAGDAYLADLPVDRIVTALDRVANRWLDPASVYRREAEQLLPRITGYSEPAVRKGLASYLGLLRGENLRRLLEEELPEPRVLDRFVPRARAGGWTRAFGPRLTVHVWSGNVPGLPAQSLVAALLVKSASFGKVASEEPLFATLLAESISEVDPDLAACMAVGYWRGGDAQLESIAFGQADTVIAYGSEHAIEAVRSRVPGDTRFVAYGHKLSFGAIGREALTTPQLSDTLQRAAYDVVKYDQQGCLSPHLLYVERGGDTSPREFARALSQTLGEYAEKVPRGRLTLEESSSFAQLRQQYEMRQVLADAERGDETRNMAGDARRESSAAVPPSLADKPSYEADGSKVAVFDASDAVVVYEPDPRFEASCLNRLVFVKPVDDLVADVPRLAAGVRRYLQTCGVAASSDRTRALALGLGRLGLDRVCPLGRMGDVAATWHHDGRFNLLELLRWTDLEPDASAGRWEFENPELGLYGNPSTQGELDGN